MSLYLFHVAFKILVLPRDFHHDHYLLFLLLKVSFPAFHMQLWLLLLSSSVTTFPWVSSGPFLPG